MKRLGGHLHVLSYRRPSMKHRNGKSVHRPFGNVIINHKNRFLGGGINMLVSQIRFNWQTVEYHLRYSLSSA